MPLELHRELFELIHSSSYPGIHASLRLLSAWFVWPGFFRDLCLLACACLHCQQSKIQTHVHTSVPAIPVPSRRFSHFHLDLVGPLPSSHGFPYLLTMIDRTTSWPKVALLSLITAESCVRAFLFTWVARFGVPSVLTSDCEAQFTSSIWAEVCCSLEITSSTTTSFLPQSNGILKCFHRSLKTALHVCLAGSDWFLHLPPILLGLCSIPKEDTRFSFSEAVFGSPLTVLGGW